MVLLANYLKKQTSAKVINLFCDIETFQFNEKAGYEKPSEFKNQVFSVACAYLNQDTGNIECDHSFFDFKSFLETIERNVTHVCKIKLYFHNGNGYDNHYLLYQLLNEYELKHRQMYVSQVEPDSTAIAKTKVSKNMVLEKRVKASTNLELVFKLENSKLTYYTVDTLPKTGGRSLRSLGETMYNLNLIDKDLLKSDFNYTKYNLSFDLSYIASKGYAKKIHDSLDEKQLHYIDNDVLLLANVYYNFEKIYPRFDFNKITFSQNILKEYEVSPLSKFQLTGSLNYKQKIKYSDYDFRNENLFDYLKHFYKGGLNFYNDKYVGQIIDHDITSLDINSSYPNVMYNSKIPYMLLDYSDESELIKINDNDHNFYLYEITADEFNMLIKDINSKLLRKLLVKYYSNFYENVYINTNTIKLFNLFNNDKITKLNTCAWLKFSTCSFDARDILAINYAKKTQGKNDNIVDCSNPNDIKILDKKNKHKLLPEEIAISKVILNGIYGLPALRPYYNYFRYDYENDELISVPKGFKNTERNEIFSIFVTSQALFNLLEPLQTLSPYDIDNYLYYGDTDSLYIDDRAIDKVDEKFINDYNLGAFKKEHRIQKMYLLNHKKYAFETNGKIIIHAGGVPLDSFDLDMPFEKFINTQFHAGVAVKSKRNYRTNVGTIAIYDATINLDSGHPYPEIMNKNSLKIVKIAMETIVEHADENIEEPEDILYIESPFGSYSIDEIVPKAHNNSNRNINFLIISEKMINEQIVDGEKNND